jgi:hypothetical protein
LIAYLFRHSSRYTQLLMLAPRADEFIKHVLGRLRRLLVGGRTAPASGEIREGASPIAVRCKLRPAVVSVVEDPLWACSFNRCSSDRRGSAEKRCCRKRGDSEASPLWCGMARSVGWGAGCVLPRRAGKYVRDTSWVNGTGKKNAPPSLPIQVEEQSRRALPHMHDRSASSPAQLLQRPRLIRGYRLDIDLQ